jgi:hypothetical protein
MNVRERPFTEALRDELVRAAQRQAVEPLRSPRRLVPRPVALAAAALALVVLASALLLGSPKPAEADIRIEEKDGRIIVTLLDLEHRASVIEHAVRARGLDVTVTAVPVGPSAIGRFVHEERSGEEPTELRTVGAQGSTFAGFSLPLHWTGHLELYVGRPAAPGEGYGTFSDALAPGEPLACLDLVGMPAAAAAKVVENRDLDVTFEIDRGSVGIVRLELSQVAASPYAQWVVVRASALSRRNVTVAVAEELPSPQPGATAQPC